MINKDKITDKEGNGLTQSQIQYFLAVAQEMSFSKAAETLFVSQPAVSRQVSQLEQELGVPLFDRTNQGISITDAGREFEHFFRETQRQFQALVDRARSGSSIIHGCVNIGCAEGWDLSEFYPQLSNLLSERYPNLKLNLSGFNHDHIFSALRHGEVDVVITSESLLRGRKELSSALLTQRRGILLFSAHHPLALKPDLSLADFRNEPFYVTAPPSMKGPTMEVLSMFSDIGDPPNIEYVSTLSAAYMKLSSGRGALLCNDWMMAKNNPLFACLPLNIKRGVSLAWLTENQSTATHLFINEVLFYFQNQAFE